MSEVRLQVKNLCKNFGITKAVQNVSFNVNKGEVHALIGENGSGKSTLTNMLTGIYSIGSGTFILDGKEVHPKNQVEANNEGISIIVQELGTLSGLTVAENIFLGHEDQFVHCGIKNTNAMNKKATELLKQYGFERIKAADMIDSYNFEDRKLVEIVKATYFNPKIVVIPRRGVKNCTNIWSVSERAATPSSLFPTISRRSLRNLIRSPFFVMVYTLIP